MVFLFFDPFFRGLCKQPTLCFRVWIRRIYIFLCQTCSRGNFYGKSYRVARASEKTQRERAVNNLNCELHPLIDGQMDGYRDSNFFHRILDRQWDIIVIDCFCGFSDGSYGQLRRHAFQLALNQVKLNGIIILDDSWLFPELLTPRKGWEIKDYIGVGPCRYGVTSTAILRRIS